MTPGASLPPADSRLTEQEKAVKDERPMTQQWYKVEFYGRMPEGETPVVPKGDDEMLELGRHFADAFGFMWIDSVTMTAVEPQISEAP